MALGVDPPLLEVLRRAAAGGLVHAQRELEGACLARRRRAERARVRDQAARLLLELGRALALRVARPRREPEKRSRAREHQQTTRSTLHRTIRHRHPPISCKQADPLAVQLASGQEQAGVALAGRPAPPVSKGARIGAASALRAVKVRARRRDGSAAAAALEEIYQPPEEPTRGRAN